MAAWRRAQIAVLGQFPSSALFGKCIECGLGGSRRARALIGAGVRSREHAFGERNRRHRRPAGSGVHTLRSAVCNSRSHLDCLEAAPERFPLFTTAARPGGSASMATPLDGMICTPMVGDPCKVAVSRPVAANLRVARDTGGAVPVARSAIATPYPLRLFLKVMRARPKRFHTPAPGLEVDGTEPTRKFSFGRLRWSALKWYE